MNVDWVTIGVAIASALVTALIHTSATTTQPASPVPAPSPSTPAPAPAPGGLFHGGLLNRLRGGGSSAPTSTPAAAAPASVAPVATSHPVISSLLSILESEISSTQGQQLLNQLNSALLTLTGSNGSTTTVSVGSQTQSPTQGGSSNATSALSSTAAVVSGS